MKEKKISSNWYIAATHLLIAGFVIPVLLNLIESFVLFSVIKIIGLHDLDLSLIFNVSLVSFILIGLINTWLGVIYSSRYLDKIYFINNADSVVSTSTIYLSVITGTLGFIRLNGQINAFGIIGIIYFLLMVLVFYFSSKKYIKNNSTPDQSVE